jgi:RHS repeat-associated protein
MTYQTGALTVGSYAYDGFARLVQRTVSNVAGASGTTNYYYDEFGHVVLETDGSGNSLREYIWLGDMPVAIIDEVDTTAPVLYYVHADHLNRPIMVTNSAGEPVWQAVWKPFGEEESITGSLTYDARFPGQWFQIESGLHWNWNRHYDPGTGRYVQPDPVGLMAMLSDGPSIYGYARQSPLGWIDPNGEETPPENAWDPNGPKSPGHPAGNNDNWPGDPDEGPDWVKNPNGSGYGWRDKNGDVWCPTGWGKGAHGGPHWDVQTPGGDYRNERPKNRPIMPSNYTPIQLPQAPQPGKVLPWMLLLTIGVGVLAF